MQYLGGKSLAGPHIATVIAGAKPTGIIDPFCGGLSAARNFSKHGYAVFCSDVMLPLISLYRAVGCGWNPPESVSREEHAAARELPDNDPLKAFVGFGCSFGGTWFGGYASNSRGQNYAKGTRKSLLRDVPFILAAGGSFTHSNFLTWEPMQLQGSALYLDPPYRGTYGYKGTPAFDHAKFDRLLTAWARLNPGLVFLSEYTEPAAPHDLVWQREQKSTVSRCKKARPRVEKLFLIK